ncbi:hypothetical protein B0H10DRAFT_1941922 [Mycena sp. CBHHK59/15]|nr:hypothetical protein B0H10DRAFT_1941922 [Mycena sp. CBHHK59/15]
MEPLSPMVNWPSSLGKPCDRAALPDGELARHRWEDLGNGAALAMVNSPVVVGKTVAMDLLSPMVNWLIVVGKTVAREPLSPMVNSPVAMEPLSLMVNSPVVVGKLVPTEPLLPMVNCPVDVVAQANTAVIITDPDGNIEKPPVFMLVVKTFATCSWSDGRSAKRQKQLTGTAATSRKLPARAATAMILDNTEISWEEEEGRKGVDEEKGS